MGKRFNSVGLINWYLCNTVNFDSLSCYGIKCISTYFSLFKLYNTIIKLVSKCRLLSKRLKLMFKTYLDIKYSIIVN